ncbi:glioma pathogenesis-related protein 1 isoform X2 [Mixophyes fleayi]|uniref:glioma pathogenesis-related protein 1 isoform X2 n=1 Tax=Mixophyes fleayi TaxID=3061075 RepID=UPI003F4DD744
MCSLLQQMYRCPNLKSPPHNSQSYPSRSQVGGAYLPCSHLNFLSAAPDMLYLMILLLCLPQAILGADPPSITNENFIKSTVDTHNLIRSKVTPTASNMKYMTWDSALATIAKSWTSKCINDHNTDLRKVGLHPVFRSVGENLYNGPDTQMVAITKDWADEVAYYNYDTNECVPGEMCGHYTQVVWAESYKVGCAATKCPGSYGFIVACNYAPAESTA